MAAEDSFIKDKVVPYNLCDIESCTTLGLQYGKGIGNLFGGTDLEARRAWETELKGITVVEDDRSAAAD